MSNIKAELIQSMGSDLTVVNAARCSFDKESSWEFDYTDTATLNPSKSLSDRDVKLIKYLATHGHFTPFTHPQITLRETVPIFVARQRFKHVIGFTYNEVSRRYVDDAPEFYVPETWRKRAENKKQGSLEEVVKLMLDAEGHEDSPQNVYLDFCSSALDLYNDMLDAGVCPEQARMVLPQSMMTSYYVTGSLAAFARMYKQRTDSHAQKEIQDLAVSVGSIIEPLFPVSWKALTS